MATQLYQVFLGGDLAPGRLGEDHEVVVVVAEDLAAARKQAKAKWTGYGRPHIDAVQLLEVVDGHRIELKATGETDQGFIDPSYVE